MVYFTSICENKTPLSLCPSLYQITMFTAIFIALSQNGAGKTGKNFHLIHKLLIQCYNTLAIKKEMVKKKIQLWYNAFLICSQIYKTYLHSSPILDPRAHLQPEFFIIIIYTVIQGGIVNDFLIT